MCRAAKHLMYCVFWSTLTCAPGLASVHARSILYVHDEYGTLATVNESSGKVSKIGSMGVVMTDIAFDHSGNLFGTSFDDFYWIDRHTAVVTRIGQHNIPGANALTFSREGSLYAAGARSTKLFSINVNSGSATVVKDIGFASAGDLAYAPEGPVFDRDGNRLLYFCGNPELLYMSSTDGNLVSIAESFFQRPLLAPVAEFNSEFESIAVNDLNTAPFNLGLVPRPPVFRPLLPDGPSEIVGNLGLPNVYGLASDSDGNLYGLADNAVYAIDKQTGSASVLSSFAGQGLGQVYGASCREVPEPASLVLVTFAGVAAFALSSRRGRRSDVV